MPNKLTLKEYAGRKVVDMLVFATTATGAVIAAKWLDRKEKRDDV